MKLLHDAVDVGLLLCLLAKYGYQSSDLLAAGSLTVMHKVVVASGWQHACRGVSDSGLMHVFCQHTELLFPAGFANLLSDGKISAVLGVDWHQRG